MQLNLIAYKYSLCSKTCSCFNATFLSHSVFHWPDNSGEEERGREETEDSVSASLVLGAGGTPERPLIASNHFQWKEGLACCSRLNCLLCKLRLIMGRRFLAGNWMHGYVGGGWRSSQENRSKVLTLNLFWQTTMIEYMIFWCDGAKKLWTIIGMSSLKPFMLQDNLITGSLDSIDVINGAHFTDDNLSTCLQVCMTRVQLKQIGWIVLRERLLGNTENSRLWASLHFYGSFPTV